MASERGSAVSSVDRPPEEREAGSQVHLRVDETWRSCLQFWRKGLLHSHVALEFLSDRFISRFLHLHPSPPPLFNTGQNHSWSPSLYRCGPARSLSSLLSPSFALATLSTRSSVRGSSSVLSSGLVFLTAGVSASKCVPRMRNSEDVTW